MSEEMQKRLFKPFEQENAETAQKYGGSGLGLSIVKSLVEMMDGTISAVSLLNKGTSFTIDLPLLLAPIKPDENPLEKKTNEPVKYDFHGARILLAEDNAINREIAVELLKKANIVTDCATNGEEAVAMFSASKENQYQLILMDIQMPVMNGYEATKVIRSSQRKEAKSIPIYAMTANAYPEDVTHALSFGMNGHIAKPIDPSILYRTMEDPSQDLRSLTRDIDREDEALTKLKVMLRQETRRSFPEYESEFKNARFFSPPALALFERCPTARDVLGHQGRFIAGVIASGSARGKGAYMDPPFFDKIEKIAFSLRDEILYLVKEDFRKPEDVIKKHFKFYYHSLFQEPGTPDPYILLDVVFEQSPYLHGATGTGRVFSGKRLHGDVGIHNNQRDDE